MPASLLNNLEAPDFYGEKILHGSLSQDANPGPEKSSSTPGDWTAGANWAFAGTVCTHTAGATATLSRDTSEVANEIYRVIFPVAARTAGSVTMSIGGVSGTARSTNATFTEFIIATGTGNLTFTPSSDFDGNIDIASVSVKRVAVVAADRVTMWVGDRLSAGVAQAGDAGLFVRSEDGTLLFLGDKLGPVVNDGLALGSATESFSDLFLASGGVINWNNGNMTITHAAGELQLAGGPLRFDNNQFLRWRNAAGDGDWSILRGADGSNNTLLQSGGILSFSGASVAVASGVPFYISATAAYADNGQLLEVNKSADDGGIALFCWSTTDAERALLEFHKSSSATIGTKALVADEEAAGGIVWKVADGAVNWSPIASIEGYVDTAPGAGDTGGRLVFYTTADGAASVTERMRISQNGYVGIGGAATPAALFEVKKTATYSGGMVLLDQTTDAATENYILKIRLREATTANPSYPLGIFLGNDDTLPLFRVERNQSSGAGDVYASGFLKVKGGPISVGNATEGGIGLINIRSTRILTAALSGATVNMAFQIPSGAMLLGAQFNVNTLIEGATSWSAAFNTGSTTSLGTGLALTLDTKVNKLIVPEIATAATDITLTAAGSNFTAGVIEGIVYFIDQTSMANA